MRAAWNWATPHGIVDGPFPSKGTVYSKTNEKLPFMTLQQVRQKIALGVSSCEEADLWESRYLRNEEIEELLFYVMARAFHPWIYPLYCTAAYTGARRSEWLRAEITDLDFTAEVLLYTRSMPRVHPPFSSGTGLPINRSNTFMSSQHSHHLPRVSSRKSAEG